MYCQLVPLTFVFCYGGGQKMAGRNDRVIADALKAMAHAMQNQHNASGNEY